jgi:Uma2 family endonuclease
MIQALPKTTTQRVVLPGRTWDQFKRIQSALENSPGTRLFYHHGTLEIAMPGKEHEAFKSLIGQLIELFFLKNGIVYKSTGSMTLEREGETSLQADESYCLGQDKPIPDLSVEVVYSSGDASKLTKYQALGVPEVWFWEDGALTLYHLRSSGYECIERSELPGMTHLDVALLSRCILKGETSHLEAAQEWFTAI